MQDFTVEEMKLINYLLQNCDEDGKLKLMTRLKEKVNKIIHEMDDGCMRCDMSMDGEGRTLFMACTYAMEEFDVPYSVTEVGDRKFYTLKVCKNCRGEWMHSIEKWFNHF
jgi:hypothetical protein